MAERVDVLVIYDQAIFVRERRLRLMRDKGWPQRSIERQTSHLAAAVEARAAAVELIEAQRKAHDAMLLADWNVPSLCTERQHAAYLASCAALARVGGVS